MADSLIGALLAVVVREAGDDGVRRVLDRAGETRSPGELLTPGGWSSHDEVVAVFRAAAELLDDPDVGRRAGVEVFHQYAGTEVLALLRSLGSPGELLRVYPAISAKQSTVTHAEVLEVGEAHGLLSVTTPGFARDPLLCGYTVGAISQFPVLFGMDPAVVTEEECLTRGDDRCLLRITWDPTSSSEHSQEQELATLREQVDVLTKRYEALESVARELSATHDVDRMLELITRQAGVAVRAPRYLLVAELPGEDTPRVHHVGFSPAEAATAAREVLASDVDGSDASRLVVDIDATGTHFGRLAAFYPGHHRFLPQERTLLQAYAGHAAAALETAAALAEARDRNATLSSLLALGRALAEQSTREGVARSLADAMPGIAGLPEAHVLLWDASDSLLHREATSAGTVVSAFTPRTAALAPEDVGDLIDGIDGPVAVDASATGVLSTLGSLTGLRRAVAVPLTARTTVYGFLVVGGGDRAPVVDDALAERLSGVAGLAATSFDSVELLEEVRHQALHDPVTELANHRLFEDRVSHQLSIARRNGRRIALLFVDLDRFKAVNDRYGHHVGDGLLRAVADRLLTSVRDEDTVARIGGDEFGILAQDCDSWGSAEVVAQRVVSVLAEPFTVEGLTLTIGASVGVTMFPVFGDDYDSVVARADAAMYEAKARGRGRFERCLVADA